MTKKLYLYKSVDVCDPGSGVWHEEGGLVVICTGYPNDSVRQGTGNEFKREENGRAVVKHGLPEPDLVITVPDDTEDAVIAFPNQGCC